MLNDRFIPLSVPNITGNELKYVTEAVESQWVSTAGGSITSFENQFSEYLDIKDSCACQSGTAGLHLCLRHFGIEQDDIVLVPTLTFIATINSIMYQKATPVFFDCYDNLCINTRQIVEYIEEHCSFNNGVLSENRSKKRVKAIMPVHIFGDVCDMDTIMDIAQKYNLIVIEDATESLGSIISSGRYKGRQSGTVGHAGVFSFNGNKIITTGGGGMIVSMNQKVIEHTRYLSQQAKNDSLYFVHDEVGYNYRMTNLQAALGLGQLEQLDKFIKTKVENYELYKMMLEGNKLGYLLPFKEEKANKWFYSFVLYSKDPSQRDGLIKYLNNNNIQARPIWKLNHTQKPFVHYFSMDCTIAEEYYHSVINLPCSSNLSKEDIEVVSAVINNYK